MRSQLGIFFTVLFFCCWRAAAVAVNRTIDDTLGDIVTGNRPVYLPPTPGVWADATCKGCAIQPDPRLAFKGTWTAATYNSGLGSVSVELSFKGTAIYVFFILANFVADGITTETACNFTLDGSAAGSFSHIPSTSTALQYNALVFSQTNLPNTDHKFVASTSGITDRHIFVNFDYAIYTADDTPPPPPPPPSLPGTTSTSTSSSSTSSSPTTSTPPSPSTPTSTSTSTSTPPSNLKSNSATTSSSQESQTTPPLSGGSNGKSVSKLNVGAVVGGVVGGVIVLLALVLLFIFCRRRRQSQSQPSEFYIDPPTTPLFAAGSQTNRTNPSLPFNAASGSAHSYDRRETHSDFLQRGTIISPYSDNPGVPSYYMDNQQNPASRDPSTALDTSVSDNTESAYGGTTSDTSIYGGLAAAPLVPVRPGSTATLDPHRDAIRRARQSEIDHQLRTMTRQMSDLKTDITTEHTRRLPVRGFERTRSDDVEMMEMREQMQLMRGQIDHLRAQQQSEWALGLSDAPPPGYEARVGN